MGMFDTIMADFKCPHCEYKIPKENMENAAEDNDLAWQTKATDCSLNTYKIGDDLEFEKLKIKEGWMEIYHICPECKKFVNAEIEIKDNKLSDKVVYLEANGQ